MQFNSDDNTIIVVVENQDYKSKIQDLLKNIKPYSCKESGYITDKYIVENKLIFQELIGLKVKELYTKLYNKNFYFIQNSTIVNNIIRW